MLKRGVYFPEYSRKQDTNTPRAQKTVETGASYLIHHRSDGVKPGASPPSKTNLTRLRDSSKRYGRCLIGHSTCRSIADTTLDETFPLVVLWRESHSPMTCTNITPRARRNWSSRRGWERISGEDTLAKTQAHRRATRWPPPSAASLRVGMSLSSIRERRLAGRPGTECKLSSWMVKVGENM